MKKRRFDSEQVLLQPSMQKLERDFPDVDIRTSLVTAIRFNNRYPYDIRSDAHVQLAERQLELFEPQELSPAVRMILEFLFTNGIGKLGTAIKNLLGLLEMPEDTRNIAQKVSEALCVPLRDGAQFTKSRSAG